MKSGHSDPVFEQLARALAALYLESTGRRPGRTVKFMDFEETGTFTALCRCMAKAVCDAMPKEAQRDQPPDMVKAIRRISAELRAETAAPATPSCNRSI